MTNAIQFLETLGGNPATGKLSASAYAVAVAELDVDENQRQALLDGDHAALNEMLGGREKMVCMIWPADEPGRTDDQPGDEQPVEDTPPDTE
jgi:hypothetical protein